jgi:hypothetical protein
VQHTVRAATLHHHSSTQCDQTCPLTSVSYLFSAWHAVLQVNQKLQLIAQGKWMDEELEERRSLSPEPVYNEHGARTNTREQRAKDKLSRQRNVSSTAGCWQRRHAQLAQRVCRQTLGCGCGIYTSRGVWCLCLMAGALGINLVCRTCQTAAGVLECVPAAPAAV